jgi:hypothetical protein
MAEPLSPAAQAVLDSMYEVNMDFNDENHAIAAAALRAAADQVVPEEQEPVPDVDSVVEMQGWARVSQRQRTRSQFLAIAAELEGFY